MSSDLYHVADRDTLLRAIRADDPALNRELRVSARRLTDEVFGREVFLRGLLEVSNECSRGCRYCGLRHGNRNLSRYRMTADEIVARARTVEDCGFPTVVMQAGEGVYTAAELSDIVRRIKDETALVITLSFGEFSHQEFRQLREAGADRYLLRHETADSDLYAALHPGYNLAGRLRCLDDLKECGYEVGSGFMVGLPGQTDESILTDLELLVDRRVHMAGIGPYVSNPDTPLGRQPDGSVDVVLNILAILRHALPGCNLPATTALDSLADDGREQGIAAGANVVMPVLTPPGHKEQYTIYPNKRCLTHDPIGCVGCTRRRLLAQGFTPSTEKGWSRTPEFRARSIIAEPDEATVAVESRE